MLKKRLHTGTALLAVLGILLFAGVGCGQGPEAESHPAPEESHTAPSSSSSTAAAVTSSSVGTTNAIAPTTGPSDAPTASVSTDRKPSSSAITAATDRKPSSSSTTTTTVTATTTTTHAPWPTAPAVSGKDSIKVLAIGNSYSVNAMTYLYDLLKAGGYQTVVLGNLFIAGCPLDTHLLNLEGDLPAYTYYRNDTGHWDSSANYRISTALASEEWDVVTLQQASRNSGLPTSYSPLDSILDYLEANRPAPHTRILWHQTWAYQGGSTFQDFARYDNDQITMYEAIVSSIRWRVVPETRIVGIIPTGTAIQNLRSSKIGDTLNPDGTHLSEGLGCYTASLTWYCALTGRAADTVTWTPNDQAVSVRLGAVQEAVGNALRTPDAITPSVKYAP